MPGVATMVQIGFAPAPPEIVDAIDQIEVESSVDVASAFRIRLNIEQTDLGDWKVLQEDLFRPLVPVTIRIQAGLGLPEALINGYVSRQGITYADSPEGSTLEVTGMDATLLMNLEEKVMPWPNLPDSAIATAILGQYQLIPEVQATGPTLVEPQGTTIQRGTDARFLRRLAWRNGFDFYVQPEPLTGLDVGHFEPRQPLGLPQAVLSVRMGDETNVSGFSIRYEMTRPTTAIAAGLDVPTKAPQPALAPVSLQPPLGIEGSLLRVLPPPIVRPADTGLQQTSELQSMAQGIVDRSTWVVAAEGEVGPGVGVLRPGGLVNVRGAGRVYNGSYSLTRVAHTITQDGYSQRFEAARNAVEMTGAEVFVEL